MKKKVLALVAAAAMVVTMIPTIAFAADNVAKIGETEYATLDEAVSAAPDGATIVLLNDATTSGLNLDKNITIQGNASAKPKITFSDKGIALRGKSLTFKDCDVFMEGIGSTPYGEWNWMTICASTDASLTLDNVTMTMDGSKTVSDDSKSTHAIYFCSNNTLNIENNSKLTITNYKHDALEWNKGDGGYNVNIINSEFVSDHNRSGFTGTFVATITDSKVDVINSTGNGSNGSNFAIKNSIVNFNGNTGHGLSAGILTIDNSKVTANNNGANGIHVGSMLSVTNNSVVTIKENICGISSQWTIPGALYVAGEKSTIDETSTVVIEDNKGSGILLKSGALTVDEGADVSIMKNKAEMLKLGGGVHIMTGASLYLPEGIKLYNNHAETAGDDIYAAQDAVVAFAGVGSNWYLDGEPDCTDKITGWFDDSENARWKAHGDDPAEYHYELKEPGEYRAEPAVIALKAAHGLITEEEVPAGPVTRTFRLTLDKQVLGVDNLPADYAVKVTVSNKFGPVRVLTLKANESQDVYLPSGEYTLTEDAPTIDGYTLKSQSFSENGFELTYGGKNVSITNTYAANEVEEPIGEPEEPNDDNTPSDEPNGPSGNDVDEEDNESDVPKTGDTMLFLMVLYALTAAGALFGIKIAFKREA